MIKIESLKNYIELLSEEDFLKLSNQIYQINLDSDDYPNHKEWYFKKQLPAITTDERDILFVRNPENSNEIIAATCLKKTNEERKICMLYVCEKYRHQGIGTKIIEKALIWLGTTKPLITFADYKLEMFKPIIKKYEWQLVEVVENFYNCHSKELCFNGMLSKQNTSQKDLYKSLVKILKHREEQLKK